MKNQGPTDPQGVGSYLVATPENSDGSIHFVGRHGTASKISRECRVFLKPSKKLPRLSSLIGVKIKVLP